MPNQKDIANEMIARLAVSDPALNTEIGTVERKIVDTVAVQLANADIDKYVMQYQFDLELYTGSDLDKILDMIAGFARQKAMVSSGYIEIYREDADTSIIIPAGTQFVSSTPTPVYFVSTSYATLVQGETRGEIAVRAVVAGAGGNLPANTIFDTPNSLSVTRATNPLPITGGRDSESDTSLRDRFKKTAFRNVSGTKDQYVGLALAHALVARANLIGQVSKSSELLTISSHSATSQNSEVASVIGSIAWVRDVETNKLFQQYQYEFVTTVNPPRIDAILSTGSPITVTLNGTTPASLSPSSFTLLPNSVVDTSVEVKNGETTYVKDTDYSVDSAAGTITRIDDGSIPDGTAVTVTYAFYPIPDGRIISLEYDFLSNLNRGSGRNLELVVDGVESVDATDLHFLSDDVFGTDTPPVTNWERIDGSNPVDGNIFERLASQPVIDIPDYIEFGDVSLEKGTDYWLVRDVSTNAFSTRAVDGIEFSAANLTAHSLAAGSEYSITYQVNRAVQAIQDLIDRNTPVATDTLVHGVKHRYFTINAVVMYTTFPRANVDLAIQKAVGDFLDTLPLGAEVQVSDILSVIHSVAGVDSVRLTLSTDDATNYGIIEYATDGSTKLGSNITGDFKLASNECAALLSVVTMAKTQESW